MEKINNFQQEPDETLYQAWEHFKELFMKCPQHYLTKTQEVILFYNGLDVPTRQILDSRGAVPTKAATDAKKAIQEMADYSQKWHNRTSRRRSTETSDGLAAIQAQLNNLGREIKKVNKKVYAAQVGCEQCKGPHYTKDCPLKEEGKTLEEAYYTQIGRPFQGGGYRATAPGFYQRNNANPLYQERRKSMEDTLRKFIGELATRHEENSNLIKEIRASTNAVIRNQGASIKTLEIQIGQISKNGSYGPQFSEAYSKSSQIDESIPQKEKDLGSFTLPCFINNVCFDNALVDLGASVSVMPLFTYLNLGLGELAHTKLTVELADRTVKYPKGIAENVLVRIGKFTFPLDFIILDMPEDVKVPLILRRPFLLLDPLNGDYIELNDLNEPFELRRNQGDDLMPTIEEGRVIEEFRTRDENLDTVIDDYPILEDMDAYRDEGMGDDIVGKPLLREVGIKARQFDGMITIYNGNDEVTYQMVRSHPRFKHHTNEQCNKIPPLLKVAFDLLRDALSTIIGLSELKEINKHEVRWITLVFDLDVMH
ncbi:putative reverse transcriptase domain-containing protein [Tanacetum coccineum]|uniref:Reverse transcriptase domain-containing protein n=1 Tax=Tanacetum coccineum TaxID=301880 RepID=A0ABQ5ETK2_9ASTR